MMATWMGPGAFASYSTSHKWKATAPRSQPLEGQELLWEKKSRSKGIRRYLFVLHAAAVFVCFPVDTLL